MPATNKEVVEALQACMNAAVSRGLRRMDVEMPPGMRLGGVEGAIDGLKKVPEQSLTKERLAHSERDLARYMAILFKPLEQALCIAFRTPALAKVAEPVWKKGGNGGKLVGLSRAGGAQRGAFGGAAAAGEADAFCKAVIGGKISHVVVVAPKAKQLAAVAELDRQAGDDVCIILLNAGLRSRVKPDPLRSELAVSFTPAFHLKLVGEPGKEGIVYRTLRDGAGATPWVFARRTVEFQEDSGEEALVAKEVGRRDLEPTAADIEAAFESVL